MDMNSHITEEIILMESKYMKRYSAPLAIRKMQVKETVEQYYTRILVAKIPTSVNTKW